MACFNARLVTVVSPIDLLQEAGYDDIVEVLEQSEKAPRQRVKLGLEVVCEFTVGSQLVNPGMAGHPLWVVCSFWRGQQCEGPMAAFFWGGGGGFGNAHFILECRGPCKKKLACTWLSVQLQVAYVACLGRPAHSIVPALLGAWASEVYGCWQWGKKPPKGSAAEGKELVKFASVGALGSGPPGHRPCEDGRSQLDSQTTAVESYRLSSSSAHFSVYVSCSALSFHRCGGISCRNMRDIDDPRKPLADPTYQCLASRF